MFVFYLEHLSTCISCSCQCIGIFTLIFCTLFDSSISYLIQVFSTTILESIFYVSVLMATWDIKVYLCNLLEAKINTCIFPQDKKRNLEKLSFIPTHSPTYMLLF